jgi:hypothetical protein
MQSAIFLKEIGSGTHSVSYIDARKKFRNAVPVSASEKQLSERCSGAFRHENNPE